MSTAPKETIPTEPLKQETETQMITIRTASWFTALPAGHLKVGISRGVPRGTKAGYRRYRALEPGPWFNSVTIPEYLERYNEILAALDPGKVADELVALGSGGVPVMLCYEQPASIERGETYCHRHIVSQWLEDRLGINVEEVDHPTLDRFAKLRQANIAPPSYA